MAAEWRWHLATWGQSRRRAWTRMARVAYMSAACALARV